MADPDTPTATVREPDYLIGIEPCNKLRDRSCSGSNASRVLPETAPSPELEATAKRWFAVHVATTEGSSDLTIKKVGPDGQAFYLATTPIITEADLAHASLSTAADGRPAVVLDVSQGGAARLREESEAYVGRYLAFVWDGQLVFCPLVHSTLGSKLIIVGGTDALPADALHEIADKVNVASSERERDVGE